MSEIVIPRSEAPPGLAQPMRLPGPVSVLASQIRYQLTLLVLSGAFGAVQSLPHWVNTAVSYLPVQPVIDAASRALEHSGTVMSVHDLAVLAGWVVGGLLISFWCFQWDPHRPAHARPAVARTTARSA